MSRPLEVALVLMNHAVGGTERRFANLYTHLSRAGRHRYTLFVTRSLAAQLAGRGLLAPGPWIVPLFSRNLLGLTDRGPWERRLAGRSVRGPNYLRSLLQRLELGLDRRRFASRSFDVAHFAFVSPLPDFIRFRRLVVECQDPHLAKEHWRSRRYRALIARADRVNVATGRIKEELERLAGGRDDRRYRVGPGTFADYTRCRVGPKEPLVVFCGRLDPMKSPLLFVEAVRELRGRGAPFRASMLGAGPLEGEVRRRIAALGLDEFLPVGPHARPEEVLARARVFCSLQTDDNYHSQALLEAMACGCAVVATDVGETARLVDAGTGRRVPARPAAVADAVAALLADPATADRLGESGRARVLREHTAAAYGTYVEELYDEAAAAGSGLTATPVSG